MTLSHTFRALDAAIRDGADRDSLIALSSVLGKQIAQHDHEEAVRATKDEQTAAFLAKLLAHFSPSTGPAQREVLPSPAADTRSEPVGGEVVPLRAATGAAASAGADGVEHG